MVYYSKDIPARDSFQSRLLMDGKPPTQEMSAHPRRIVLGHPPTNPKSGKWLVETQNTNVLVQLEIRSTLNIENNVLCLYFLQTKSNSMAQISESMYI